ncbi:hypothetical protein PUN28_003859 [Cardiocondyla obscurior]|uniref:Ribosomal protein L14 n=1 Tax=Cardiocondyla obscurior TaxID=286306 RepID=A0AAW2GMJ9_9HYME
MYRRDRMRGVIVLSTRMRIECRRGTRVCCVIHIAAIIPENTRDLRQ